MILEILKKRHWFGLDRRNLKINSWIPYLKEAIKKQNQANPTFNSASNSVIEAPKPNPVPAKPAVSVTASYVGNARTMKFHWPSCRWAKKISAGNRVGFSSREEAVESGYVPCQVCRP